MQSTIEIIGAIKYNIGLCRGIQGGYSRGDQNVIKEGKTLRAPFHLLSPYSTENCVCVGYQTQMKLTQTT